MENKKRDELILEFAKKVRAKENKAKENLTPQQLEQQILADNELAKQYAKQHGVKIITISNEGDK